MKGRRKRRSANEIEEQIVDAATKIIEDKGFLGLTIKGIMQIAEIEPGQFYSRYNDMDNFINEYVEKYDYWFGEIIDKNKNLIDEEEQYEAIIHNLFESLLGNKIIQQLLRWKLSDNNETTHHIAESRELKTISLSEKYNKMFENTSVDIVALSSIIVGGLYYLILHKDLSKFSGIDVNTDEGRTRIKNSISFLTEIFFSNLRKKKQIIETALRLKQNNIDIEIISKCTNLPYGVIQQL